MGSNAIPEINMSGNVAENWEFWRKRFLNYIKAAEIDKKQEATQCALLLHLIRPEGRRISTTFTFEENEQDKLTVLINKFNQHFLPRQNLSFKRYKFLPMRQNHLTLEQFITTLRDQANKCKFGKLKDSLIKYMITCGVNSNEIREKLLQNDEASLEDAIKICSAIIEAREQSTKISNGNSAEQENIQTI